jgi:hypothetical protein
VTERDWLNAVDTSRMLDLLRDSGRASNRKLRLFACACCRRVWGWYEFHHEEGREAVATSERYADGLATPAELTSARRAAAGRVPDGLDKMVAGVDAAMWYGSSLIAHETATDPWPFAGQAELVRDIFGNPFRPLQHLAPSLLERHDGLVRKLAQATYEYRDLPSGHLEPSRLAVLADALEEAGVSEGGLLDHLRGPGPHVRGCFALDLVLGRN